LSDKRVREAAAGGWFGSGRGELRVERRVEVWGVFSRGGGSVRKEAGTRGEGNNGIEGVRGSFAVRLFSVRRASCGLAGLGRKID